MGAQKNRLIATVLLSTHNICLGREIRKIFYKYTFLSGGLTDSTVMLLLSDADRIHIKYNVLPSHWFGGEDINKVSKYNPLKNLSKLAIVFIIVYLPSSVLDFIKALHGQHVINPRVHSNLI